jgi:cysteinyl-tRNA synthetase
MKKVMLTNTLTREKEELKTLSDDKVLLYGCGVTPYDHSHIGHGRSYVEIDVVVRLLRFLGYSVTYVRNFTDIDDKLIKKAEEKGDLNLYKEIAEEFIESYGNEMDKLNCLKPNIEPRVTENIPQIIKFIEELIEAKKAYVVDGDVYFDIESFKEYGKLSGRKLEDLQAGARVDVDKRKKNPFDFALWKGNNEDLFWESPWGYGRPGWHIECSALAKEYLGESIDIHCGGMDLIFPHHENEIAQSESLSGKPFANYWIHNAFLNIDKEKMSKSLGNILALHEIFKKYDSMILRFYFLQHHYRTPIEFSWDRLDAAAVAYKKLVKSFENVETASDAIGECLDSMTDALCDDFNTTKALGILFEGLGKWKESEVCMPKIKFFLQNVLGLTLNKLETEIEITPEIETLIEEREQARRDKNWKVADEIRDRLIEMGYSVEDKKL